VPPFHAAARVHVCCISRPHAIPSKQDRQGGVTRHGAAQLEPQTIELAAPEGWPRRLGRRPPRTAAGDRRRTDRGELRRSAARDAIDWATRSASMSLRHRLGRTDPRAGSGVGGSAWHLAHRARGLAGGVATITIDHHDRPVVDGFRSPRAVRPDGLRVRSRAGRMCCE
jgi:hypothetical protein